MIDPSDSATQLEYDEITGLIPTHITGLFLSIHFQMVMAAYQDMQLTLFWKKYSKKNLSPGGKRIYP